MAGQIRLSRRIVSALFLFVWIASAGILRADDPATAAASSAGTSPEFALTDDQMLELVQRQTFRYFYDFLGIRLAASPVNAAPRRYEEHKDTPP